MIRQQKYVMQLEQPQRGIAIKSTITDPRVTVALETRGRYQTKTHRQSQTKERNPKMKPRRRKYTKQTEKKKGRRFPVCEKINGGTIASTEPILSQVEIDKQLPYIPKEIYMEGEIGTTSTPLGQSAILFIMFRDTSRRRSHK